MKAAAFLMGLAALVSGSAVASGPRSVSDLGWMAGEWVEEKDGRWTEENWSLPRGGVMLGSGRSGRGERVADWEFLRIEADETGVPTYWGSPKGASAIPFRLVRAGRGQAIFENPKHDYPARIVYRRDGEALVATISGAGGTNPMSWRYRRR